MPDKYYQVALKTVILGSDSFEGTYLKSRVIEIDFDRKKLSNHDYCSLSIFNVECTYLENLVTDDMIQLPKLKVSILNYTTWFKKL